MHPWEDKETSVFSDKTSAARNGENDNQLE